MNSQISDLPSSPAATGLEATETVTPNMEKGITDEMITDLKNYCKRFGQEGEDAYQSTLCWGVDPRHSKYVARHPNIKALLRFVTKCNYCKILREQKRCISLNALQDKGFDPAATIKKDEDVRIKQAEKYASPRLKMAIKLGREGHSFTKIAEYMNISSGRLTQLLSSMAGKSFQNQLDLFWEKGEAR